MIKLLTFFLTLSFFFLVDVHGANEKTVLEAQRNNELDNQFINDFLLDPRDPFQSLIPKPLPVVKPKIEPKTPKIPEAPKTDPVEKIAEKLKISGLVWGSDQPQAIINGKVLGIGDKIETLLIVAIVSKGVVLKNEDGSRFFLKNEIK